MKKSLMRFLFGALRATVSLTMSARAQSNLVFAREFDQSNNRFGLIDLTYTDLSGPVFFFSVKP
jgi:hypothetical protein